MSLAGGAPDASFSFPRGGFRHDAGRVRPKALGRGAAPPRGGGGPPGDRRGGAGRRRRSRSLHPEGQARLRVPLPWQGPDCRPGQLEGHRSGRRGEGGGARVRARRVRGKALPEAKLFPRGGLEGAADTGDWVFEGTRFALVKLDGTELASYVVGGLACGE